MGRKNVAVAKRERKLSPLFLISTDAAQGIVEAIVSVFGVLDDGSDIIMPGAFAKTITEHAHRVKVLDQHKTGSIQHVIGKTLAMREVGRDGLPPEVLQRYPEATGGLWTQTQYLMKTPEGVGAFERIASGAIDEYSIGYDALQVQMERIDRPDGVRVVARKLIEIRLWEYSPVIWGMNPATATVNVKSGDEPEEDEMEGDTLPLDQKERKASTIGAVIQGIVVIDPRSRDWLSAGVITLDEYGLIQQAYVEAARAAFDALPADLRDRELPTYNGWDWMSREGDIEAKAGTQEDANAPEAEAPRDDAERETEAKAGAEPGTPPLTQQEIERELLQWEMEALGA